MRKAIFIDSLWFIRTISFKKIWNGLLLRISYFVSKISGRMIHWGHPESMSIEPTNLCNLKCPECPSGNNTMNRARLFISVEDYKAIIDQNYQYLSFLQLYFQGEPFMHPRIYDFIKYSCQHKIYTSTSTNGQFLNKESALQIIESGLHRLIISIDGTSQEVYAKYRVGGSLDKVLDGIKLLKELKKEKKSRTPFIIIQFVVFKTNEHQIDEIKELARKLQVDALKIKSAQIEDFQSGNVLMTSNDKYNRYKKSESGKYILKRKHNFKCKRIWNGLVVSANKDVLPCCFDKDGANSFGSLSDIHMESINKNEKVIQFRKEVWKLDNPHEICKNCTEGIKRTWF